MIYRRLAVLSLVILLLSALAPIHAAQTQTPKNVIFLIGDGMGIAQVTLARLTLGKPLNMDSMPVGGFAATHSANSAVTDSAAAGSALATGFKTNNGMISTLPDGTKAGSILEAAEKMGKATGLITTVSVTDATPAVFASHVKSRKEQPSIAVQLVGEKVDIILGGGRGYFKPKSQPGSKREDETDVISQAKAAGYQYVDTREGLFGATSTEVLGLFEDGDLTTEAPEPTLAEMADKAISLLSRDKDGFFVMIEGGQIDRKCHANDAAGTIKQTLDFDTAVGKALEYARATTNTLVIVTADHETGGLTVLGSEEGGNNVTPSYSTKSHSAVNVPVFAFGPGASTFGGVMDNTDIPKRIAQLWGIKDFAK